MLSSPHPLVQPMRPSARDHCYREFLLQSRDNRRRQHEGAENHQRQRRADNIHRPLDERILRAEHGAARFHDGDAEGLHMLRSGDDHVANVGDEVARHVLVDAGLPVVVQTAVIYAEIAQEFRAERPAIPMHRTFNLWFWR